VLDLDAPVAVEAEKLLSKSKNTPYDGWRSPEAGDDDRRGRDRDARGVVR